MSLTRIISMGLILFLGMNCTSRTLSYNPFKIAQEQFYRTTKTIALTPLQVPEGLGDRVSLNTQFESFVEANLRKGGFEVLRSRVYKEIWDAKAKQIGGYFDPRTGEVDKSKYESIVNYTKKELKAAYNVDALLYSGLRIVQVRFNGTWVSWHGVEERIILEGKKPEVIRGNIAAVSFGVWIEDINGIESYVNFGGIQLLSKLDVSGTIFKNMKFVAVPEEEILSNQKRNEAAVEIALDPLMKKPTSSSTLR
jgi:hypothetical protein